MKFFTCDYHVLRRLNRTFNLEELMPFMNIERNWYGYVMETLENTAKYIKLDSTIKQAGAYFNCKIKISFLGNNFPYPV